MTISNCANENCDRRFFRPNVRILESAEAVELIAEVPGADEHSTDVTVENDTLTLTARVADPEAVGRKVVYTELRDGDYRRSFQLSDKIDRQRIEARVKDGVLRVRMPKSDQAVSKKIAVLAG